MIVIPPAAQHEAYFTGIAEDIWKTATTDKSELYKEMIQESKTLVISFNLNVGGDTKIGYNCHFRFFKDTLYCFIEELGVSENAGQ